MSRNVKNPVDKALQLLERGRLVPAFRALKHLAEGGEHHAYHMLGYMYDVGEGTVRSRRLAMNWYLKAFEAGNSTSAVNIATVYRDQGDVKLELAWYKRAAALGDGDATLEVAMRYVTGKGVRRDLSRARALLKSVKRAPNTSEHARDVARQLLYALPTTRRAA